MKNQDRHFSAKVLALKEGEIWKWTPSIAFGLSDPVTGAGELSVRTLVETEETASSTGTMQSSPNISRLLGEWSEDILNINIVDERT